MMGLEELDGGDRYLVLHWLNERDIPNNSDIDWTTPHIKKSMQDVYPVFLFLFVLVGLSGLLGNLTIIAVVIKRGMYKDPLFFLLGNAALSDILKCLFVLPISVSNLTLQDWIFGSFLCYFLPMMQSYPNHASMLTYVVIAIDRYRKVVYPMKSRVPAGLCIIAIWVVSLCLVLPYAVYVKYLDIGYYLPLLKGAAICGLNHETRTEDFVRAIFVTLYILPLAFISFLFVKVSADLKSQETPNSFENSCREPVITWSRNHGIEAEGNSGDSNNYSVFAEETDDLDVRQEKQTQKYLICMVVTFGLCWWPVQILDLVTNLVLETEENTSHFDVTYTTFVLFGFLSTCSNPILFASWQMSHSTKDRLKGYFHFSGSRRRHERRQSESSKLTQGSYTIDSEISRISNQD
ncbi:neuropeptide Y receptor type 2 [Lingula anatina]|uniref:Neuropeptide Y receptor type 2 n=1 Tax=Lingula anatina TaxID=7574 RepID=A0A1S3J947_LINAN|nr:neuropeptide Y receptor type 2 [Lingula anatina]|eukprot:XP_013406746.2 neuropeptide Y receptor type 2 [Lingula anatina]